MKKTLFKILTAGLLAATLIFGAGCTGTGTTASSGDQSAATSNGTSGTVSVEKTKVRVATLSGPTGIGMSQLFELDEKGESGNDYEFSIHGDPTEIVGKVSNNEIDIASIPTNLAANLYKKTSGKIQVAAVNTLGVLHILDSTGEIKSVEDLRGKTIYATGEGSTPEYALNYVLQQNGLTVGEDVTVVYKAEHAELATLCISGEAEIALLPEPFVTNVMSKTDVFTKVLNVSEEWEKVSNDTAMAMGCIIVSKEFAENNSEALETFMTEYQNSVSFVNSDPAAAGALVEKHGILPSAAVAEKAIPNCNIVFITGDEMKTAAKAFYDVLFAADPTSIGGAIPEDGIYYVK